MQTKISPKTSWSEDEVREAVTVLAGKRYNVDFDTYVKMVQDGDDTIDQFRDIDILGLLALIGVHNRNFEPIT